MNTEQTNTATQTPTHKVGRPRKYHTEEEYEAARRKYYSNRKIEDKQKVETRAQINSLRDEVAKLLQTKAFILKQLRAVQFELMTEPPANTPEEVPQQSDTDS